MTNHDFEKALAALKALTHNDEETPMMIDMACWLIDHLDEVSAALQAAIANPAQVPDGWKLVPVEPTGGQIMYGIHCLEKNDDLPDIGYGPKSVAIYRAMLSAAPDVSDVG